MPIQITHPDVILSEAKNPVESMEFMGFFGCRLRMTMFVQYIDYKWVFIFGCVIWIGMKFFAVAFLLSGDIH